jgi:hypothetical protein
MTGHTQAAPIRREGPFPDSRGREGTRIRNGSWLPSSQARLLRSLVNDGRRGPQRLLIALQLILR